jgi:phytoene/squalene synthetase
VWKRTRRLYSRLLDAIEKRDYDVLGKRVAVPGWRKATLGIGTWVRARLKLPLGR